MHPSLITLVRQESFTRGVDSSPSVCSKHSSFRSPSAKKKRHGSLSQGFISSWSNFEEDVTVSVECEKEQLDVEVTNFLKVVLWVLNLNCCTTSSSKVKLNVTVNCVFTSSFVPSFTFSLPVSDLLAGCFKIIDESVYRHWFFEGEEAGQDPTLPHPTQR